MPEGPSIVILREEADRFAGHAIIDVAGNSKVDLQRLHNQTVLRFRTWGQHFLIEFADFSVRIHLLLFGSYRIDERKDAAPRLQLVFDNGELNFYGCSVQFIEEPLDDRYDWSVDIMAHQWSARKALARLRTMPNAKACDAMLDQDVFAGAGNIFKNEVLFRIRVHPLSLIGALPARTLQRMVRETRAYAFQFLEWKKAYVLKKHWLAHRQKTCARCDIPLEKKRLGRGNRQSFFCERCQKLYR
jgi:endonuclease-8